ncbi:hypothetical protein Goshw_012481 [Gossypium schwendimanii]|uniref:Uncharacterized protein n=1 Tax=Gossypium schwendimanii TaxID=34291 RepID=A0A7J9LGE2_GOSSC|nr:hypothetical protein [Gossypium schwendimanii]
MGCLAKLKLLKELEQKIPHMDETLEHLFISCSFSRAMWFRSSFGFMPDYISLINLDRLLRLGKLVSVQLIRCWIFNKRILTQKHVPAFSQQNKMQTSYFERSRIRFQKISAPSFILCEE